MKFLTKKEWQKSVKAPDKRDVSGRFIKGEKNPNRNGEERHCLSCGNPFWAVGSKIKEGKGKYCGMACFKKSIAGKHHSPQTQFKKGQFTKEKHWKWKGGITPENVKIRTSIEYILWRNAVLARDGYTCQKYGTRGVRMAVHHIQNFSEFPKLRFAIDNGITISDKAHKEFHRKYGRTHNTRKQLEEFLFCNNEYKK